MTTTITIKMAREIIFNNNLITLNITKRPGCGGSCLSSQHWEAEAGRSFEARSLRPACQHGETPSLLKIQKISWARWHVPVILATQEAEAGESPEPRRRRLRWAEIAPLHSSLGDKSETLSQKKKKKMLKSVHTLSYNFIYSKNILLK